MSQTLRSTVLDRVLRRRHFADCDFNAEINDLVVRVTSGDLRSATSALRVEPVRRAARVAASTKNVAAAKTLGAQCRQIDPSAPLTIEDAWISAASNDVPKAIDALWNQRDPEHRSALLAIIRLYRGAPEARTWLSDAKLTAADFSSNGSVLAVNLLLDGSEWDRAYAWTQSMPVEQRHEVPTDGSFLSRRVSMTTLADMHPIIQAAMGWRDAHLHEFDVGLTYGDTWSLSAERTDDDARVYDAQEVRMRDFSREPGVTFTYVYDFGDNWRHTVRLEKLVAATPAPKKPSCIDGSRCCPPEDVGGTSGYFDFLRVLLAPEPDEADEQLRMKRWSGGRFDPEKFDLAKTDKAVCNALRRARS